MIRTYSFYRHADGMFTGLVATIDESRLAQHLRPEIGAMEGEYDSRRNRVVSGRVVSYTPPRPPDTDLERFDLIDGAWVSRPTVAALWATVRGERDRRLAASDWIVARATERGESIPTPWLTYRQALRDITEQSDPAAIVWPTKP